MNDEIKKYIFEYFDHKKYPTKVNLGRDVENVTESGKTIHANRFCGSGYANLVPFSHAVLHGYTKLCKKCAQGTYVEVLFEKYGLK